MTANTTPASTAIPAGSDTFTDHEWDTATDRVHATRDKMLTNPKVAAAETAAFDSIARRPQTLAAIRRARGLTQSQMSNQMDISQAEISRMERRTNLHLETLARFIEATGGTLRITAVFDDDEVDIGIGDLFPT